MLKKLTAQGPNDRKSYTVTLPVEWIKKQGLNKTKLVDLEIVQNKIILSQTKNIQPRILMNADKFKNSMTKTIPTIYKKGINEIKIQYSDNKQAKEITDIIEQKLIGFQIVEQGKNYLIIQDIIGESEERFDTLLRRTFLLLIEIAETSSKEEAEVIDKNISKIINYCERILIKKGHTEYEKIPIYYLILDRIEKLKDEFIWLAQISSPKNTEFKKIQELLRKTYELYFSFNIEIYDQTQNQTYILKNKYRQKTNLTQQEMHYHNIARILNSMIGDIFNCQAVKYT